MNLTIRELIKIFNGELVLGDPKIVVNRAIVDSRMIQPGDLFFALKGQKTDGHNFASTAALSGAGGCVVSNLSWISKDRPIPAGVIRVEDPFKALHQLAAHLRKNFNGPVIGITGSNGKTTTKQMVANIMKYTGAGLVSSGNLNSQVGLPLVMSELKENDRWMVLEMGASERGNIATLCELAQPRIGAITSIGPAHLQTFGDILQVAATKWELIESLPHDGVGIVPWGVPQLEPHIRSCQKKIIFFGTDSSCPIRASSIETGPTMTFRLHMASEAGMVHLPIGGRFNVMNALASAAVGWVVGRSLTEVVNALETFEPPLMRMEYLTHKSGAVLVNDAYNANPASMIESIRSIVESNAEKKKVLVLGSMLELGKDSDRMHFHLGTELGRMPLEKVFLVGAEAEKIREGAEAVGSVKNKFEWFEDTDKVTPALADFLNLGTVVLFKGSRGIRLERIINVLMVQNLSSGEN